MTAKTPTTAVEIAERVIELNDWMISAPPETPERVLDLVEAEITKLDTWLRHYAPSLRTEAQQ